MGDRLFERGESPYENADALSDRYTPETLVGRDAELDKFRSFLQPVIYGEDPKNIFLYGKTGVGKTAATKYLLNNLEEDIKEYDDTNITTVYCNCDGLDTSFRVAVSIVNELRDPANQIPESGYSTSEVYKKMWTEIEKTAEDPDDPEQTNIVLVVLDEVDHTESGEDSILYQLSRAEENNFVEDTRVGIIGISNDLDFANRLSPKVESSICQKRVFFNPYDASELADVLQQRADIAFKDGVLEDGVIEKCAAYGAQRSGDAREALDLLKEAGDIARARNDEKVRANHVAEGIELMEREAITEGIESLHNHAQYLLYALVTLDAEDNTPARTEAIYDRYKTIVRMTGLNPLSSRRVTDIIQQLEMLSPVEKNEHNRGSAGGRYYTYNLAKSRHMILRGLATTIQEIGIHETIEDEFDPETLD